MKRFHSLEDCLIDAFANRNFFNPQEDRYMWAIHEGLRRLNLWTPPWRRVQARKIHKCVRNCTISDGDIYFMESGMDLSSYQDVAKYCAGCMAMILYFKEVGNLPPNLYTHWDDEKKAAVKIEKEKPSGS
jgi:hypothetical protein